MCVPAPGPESLCLVQIGAPGQPTKSWVVPNREFCSNVKGTNVLWSVDAGAVLPREPSLSLCFVGVYLFKETIVNLHKLNK